MKMLDRHIGSSFLRSFTLIFSILLALFSFLELVAQLDDVGKGTFGINDALAFAILTIPRRMLDLMPISTLLGSIIALGLLSDHGELLAMQAGGVSIRQICWAVLATGTILILLTGVLAEMLVPPLDQLARRRRALAVSGTGITLTQQGFWARRESSFIHVGKTLYGGTVADMDVFETDEKGRLKAFIHAREADIQNDNRWILKEIIQKTFSEQGIETDRKPQMILESFLSADQVTVLELPADSLSSADLFRYIGALRQSGQNADRYELALWRKLSIPLTTGAMVLLSLPFIFGSTRQVTAGKRVMIGSLVGIVLYFGDQVMVYIGLLLGLAPAITAMAPVILISAAALWRLQKVVSQSP